jgi:hypothetical protein
MVRGLSIGAPQAEQVKRLHIGPPDQRTWFDPTAPLYIVGIPFDSYINGYSRFYFT